jgi:hypothetical protein
MSGTLRRRWGRWWEASGTLLNLDDVLNVPVLDETEKRWSDAQRHRLAAALLGYGLERFAVLRYDIDDIRKIAVARVA